MVHCQGAGLPGDTSTLHTPGAKPPASAQQQQRARCGLAHAERCSDYGGAGAVWDVWPAADADLLRHYVAAHMPDVVAQQAQQPPDVLLDGFAMLTSRHLDALAAGAWAAASAGAEPGGGGVAAAVRPCAPWHFEQYAGEVVLVPAGCPRQVRRTRRLSARTDADAARCRGGCLSGYLRHPSGRAMPRQTFLPTPPPSSSDTKVPHYTRAYMRSPHALWCAERGSIAHSYDLHCMPRSTLPRTPPPPHSSPHKQATLRPPLRPPLHACTNWGWLLKQACPLTPVQCSACRSPPQARTCSPPPQPRPCRSPLPT
eukprot:15308-Chlamydomonas_euryale.AAC.5